MIVTNKPVTADVLAKINPVTTALTWFDTILKHWHREAGSKPAPQMLMVALLLGKRPGVEALHIAMTLRAEGCTVQQFCLAGSCGPANNYRRALVKSGWFSCTVTGKPYAFTLGFTAKGEAKVMAAQAALAAAGEQPVKPAKKAKRKAKAKKAAQMPVSEPATSEPVTGSEAGTVGNMPAVPANNAESGAADLA